MTGVNASVPMDTEICFHDFLPMMAKKMDQDEFLEELCNGFRILADPRTQTITVGSLKKNARWLGLENMTDQELREMISEGDGDGDGALNEREFCVLMIRTSPALLEQAEELIMDALDDELAEFMDDDDEAF